MPRYHELTDIENKGKTVDVWEQLGMELGAETTDWMAHMEELGISVLDAEGKNCFDEREIREKLQTKELFFFGAGLSGPIAVNMKDGKMRVSDPMELTDFVKEEDIPSMPEPTAAPAVPQTEEERERNLRIDEQRGVTLTEEQLQLAHAVITVPEMPELPKNPFEDHIPDFQSRLPRGFVREDKSPEELLPPKPQPLTRGQRLWDGFVSIFRRGGSARGREFRAAEARRQQAERDYPDWAKRYNKALIERSETQDKIDSARELLRQQKALRDTPAFLTYLMQQERERKYAAEVERYRVQKTDLLQKNPFAALMDMQQNGLTQENLTARTQYLKERLSGRVCSAETEDLIAESILLFPLKESVDESFKGNMRRQTQSGRFLSRVDAGQILFDKKGKKEIGNDSNFLSDHRKDEAQLDLLRDPAKRGKAIRTLKESAPFRAMMEEFAGEKIDLAKMSRLYQKEETKQIDERIPEMRRKLVEELGAHSVGNRTKELLVKLVMLDESEKKYKNTLGKRDLSSYERGKKLSVLTRDVNADFLAVSKENARLEQEQPDIAQRVKDGSGEELSPEERVYRSHAELLDRVSTVLREHPEIDLFCRSHKGIRMSGEAIRDMALGSRAGELAKQTQKAMNGSGVPQ